MFRTNTYARMDFTAVIVALIAVGAALEIGIINGSQAQVLQKTPPITPSPSTSPLPSPSSTISPQEKSKLCDPNNPKLRFVNTTESHICGIPKTTKNVTTTTATTTTPTPASSIPPPPRPKPISPLSPNPITPPSSESPPQERPIPGLP
jgi:hypothetical protein